MNNSTHLAMLIAASLWPQLATSAMCEVLPFDTFRPDTVAHASPELVAMAFTMQPVASLRIPSGFTRWGAFPYGSIGFGDHPGGIVGVLGYETRESVSIHKSGVSPADFMRSVFRGLDQTGCEYMKGQGLADEDYRLHAALAGGAELFAYGKADTHRFHVIRADRPEHVLSGMFKNISRAEFEIILSTIVIN